MRPHGRFDVVVMGRLTIISLSGASSRSKEREGVIDWGAETCRALQWDLLGECVSCDVFCFTFFTNCLIRIDLKPFDEYGTDSY